MVKFKSLQELQKLNKKKFSKLTKVEFGGLNVVIDEEITKDNLPPNITHLEFIVHYFDEKVDNLPSTLKHLTIISSFFNKSIDNLPSSLTHLIISSDEFDKPINTLPSGLTHFELTADADLDGIINTLPPNLKHLTIDSDYFNQPIDTLPSGLTHLTIKKSFNTSIDNLPSTLTHLELRGDFNKSIDHLPSTLTHLKLGYSGYFDKPIDHLPSGLTHLELSDYYDIKLINVDKLPTSLISISPENVWELYNLLVKKKLHSLGKKETNKILLKQDILTSKKYKQLFLLFEKMCGNVKNEKDIHKLRGMAESLEIKNVENKNKEELCGDIGASILIKLNLATRFEPIK